MRAALIATLGHTYLVVSAVRECIEKGATWCFGPWWPLFTPFKGSKLSFAPELEPLSLLQSHSEHIEHSALPSILCQRLELPAFFLSCAPKPGRLLARHRKGFEQVWGHPVGRQERGGI